MPCFPGTTHDATRRVHPTQHRTTSCPGYFRVGPHLLPTRTPPSGCPPHDHHSTPMSTPRASRRHSCRHRADTPPARGRSPCCWLSGARIPNSNPGDPPRDSCQSLTLIREGEGVANGSVSGLPRTAVLVLFFFFFSVRVSGLLLGSIVHGHFLLSDD